MEENDQISPALKTISLIIEQNPEASKDRMLQLNELITLCIGQIFEDLINAANNSEGGLSDDCTEKDIIDYVTGIFDEDLLSQTTKRIQSLENAVRNYPEAFDFYIRFMKYQLINSGYQFSFKLTCALYIALSYSIGLGQLYSVTVSTFIQHLACYLTKRTTDIVISEEFPESQMIRLVLSQLKCDTREDFSVYFARYATNYGLFEINSENSWNDYNIRSDCFKCYDYAFFLNTKLNPLINNIRILNNCGAQIQGLLKCCYSILEVFNMKQTPFNYLKTLTSNQHTCYYPSDTPISYEKLLMLNVAEYAEIQMPNNENNNKPCITLYAARLSDRAPNVNVKDVGENFYRLKVFDFSPIPSVNDKLHGSARHFLFYGVSPIEDNPVFENIEDFILPTYLYDSIDILGPLELHILRLLVFAQIAKQSNFVSSLIGNIHNIDLFLIYQIECIVDSIAIILFPYAKVESSKNATILFLINVLEKLKKQLDTCDEQNTDYSKISLASFRRFFAKAMSSIIPGVYGNLHSYAGNLLSENLKNVVKNEPNDKYSMINPSSWRHFILPFIINASLRDICPVTYAYLRLSNHFSYVRHLPNLMPTLNLIWENRSKVESNPNYKFEDFAEFLAQQRVGSSKDQKDKETAEIEIKEEFTLFFKFWKDATKIALNGILNKEARIEIMKTIYPPKDGKPLEIFDEQEDDEEGDFYETICSIPVRGFLPFSHDRWPVLIVLECLTRAHNEFISILEQHSSIIVHSVNDDQIPKDDDFDDITMHPSLFSQYFIQSYRNRINADGLPDYDADLEKSFIGILSSKIYNTILHPLINCGAQVSNDSFNENLAGKFSKSQETSELSKSQVIFLKDLKGKGKGPGLMMILEKIMLREGIRQGHTNSEISIIEYIHDHLKESLTLIELEGFYALSAAKNQLQEEFTLKHVSKIFNLLDQPLEIATGELKSVDDLIIDKFIKMAGITERTSGEIGLDPSGNWSGLANAILYIIIDLTNSGILNNKYESKTVQDALQDYLNLNSKTLLSEEESKGLDFLINEITAKNEMKPNVSILLSYYQEAKNYSNSF